VGVWGLEPPKSQDLENNPNWARGKHLSCASHAEVSPGGHILWKIKNPRLEAKRNAITPATNYEKTPLG